MLPLCNNKRNNMSPGSAKKTAADTWQRLRSAPLPPLNLISDLEKGRQCDYKNGSFFAGPEHCQEPSLQRWLLFSQTQNSPRLHPNITSGVCGGEMPPFAQSPMAVFFAVPGPGKRSNLSLNQKCNKNFFQECF